MEEKIKNFLNNLRKLPRCTNDEHYRFADYMELKCLVNVDGEYSQSEFIDDAKQRAEDLGEGDFEENKKIKKLPNSEKNDKWNLIATDTFRVISNRIFQFGKDYPFKLSQNGKVIVLNENYEENLSYIFLLLCSDLRYTLKFKRELTSSFEALSKEVMKEVLPNAEVHLFGSSNTEDGSTEWTSQKLWHKLQWLEGFLKEKLNVYEKQFSVHDKGDRGLDIVGKIPFNDDLTNFTIIFAQCACSPHDWSQKQSDMSASAWRELISLRTQPNYFMFIPQSFRSSTGNWHDRTKFRETVILDRYRILGNWKNRDLLKSWTVFPVLKEILESRETVF